MEDQDDNDGWKLVLSIEYAWESAPEFDEWNLHVEEDEIKWGIDMEYMVDPIEASHSFCN